MARVVENVSALLRPGGIIVWHVGNDSTHHHDVMARHSQMLNDAGLLYLDTIIWRKPGANYTIPRNTHIQRSGCYYPAFQWEALLVFQKPGGPMPKMTRESVAYMAEHHTNVWDIPTVSNPIEQQGHPGPCPVELPYRCLMAYTAPDSLVLDPFAGSGTSLIACEKSSRSGFMAERIPSYCHMIVRRWEDLTGNKAELERVGARAAIRDKKA
jgi:DNA modification methylase